MTDVSIIEPDRPPVGSRMLAAQTPLQRFQDDAVAAAYVARMLAPTDFVPDSLRVLGNDQATTAAIAAALLTGDELGLSPMASMRSIDIISHTPALRAQTMLALILARGHAAWVVESTQTRCVMKGLRGGAPDDQTQTATFTIERAKALGLDQRPQWRKQPIAMLRARATAEICRMIAPDAILGLPYAAEELGDPDDGSVAGIIEQPSGSTPRRARRARSVSASAPPSTADSTAGDNVAAGDGHESSAGALVDDAVPVPAAEHKSTVGSVRRDVDEAPEPPAAPAVIDAELPDQPSPSMVSTAQRKAIMAAFGDLGIHDRAARLATSSQIIGRALLSSLDLSVEEASTLIDELQARVRSRFEQPDEIEDDPFAAGD